MNAPGPYVALAVNAGLAAASYAVKAVNLSGVLGGLLVGFIVLRFGGWGSFTILVLFFVLGSAATKLGYRRKLALGVAQLDRGRRSARHAFANCGVGAAAALAYSFVDGRVGHESAEAALVILAAAFATALFDTVSTEIGQLFGKHPFLITTFKPVPVGTDGAISVEGTLAGLAAGVLIAVVGAAFGLYRPLGILFVSSGAFIGTTFESILGAASSRGKRLDNELLNFLNTVVGGVVAGAMSLAVAA